MILLFLSIGFCSGVNYAVIIDTSRLWANYRHTSNVLVLYQIVREMGIPDSRITMMLNGDIACNSRNTDPGTVFHTRSENLYNNVELDYRGDEITKETIVRLFQGKYPGFTPRDRRLLVQGEDNLFVFLTGHSGIGFAKIQDAEELYAVDFGRVFKEMDAAGRYQSLFWIGDTCRAASLHNEFYSKNVVAVGSSKELESSYSRHGDRELGVSIVDRFSFHSDEVIRKALLSRKEIGLTIDRFSKMFSRTQLLSDVSFRPHSGGRNATLVEYFSGTDSIRNAEWKIGSFNLTPSAEILKIEDVNPRVYHQKETRFVVAPPAVTAKQAWNDKWPVAILVVLLAFIFK